MASVSVSIPKNSLIEKSFETIHYADSFRVEFSTIKDIDLSFCISHCLSYNPQWLKFLFTIRKAIVKPFGLYTENEKTQKKNIIPILNISKGSKIAFFEVVDFSDNEVLLLGKDSHLDACLSFILTETHGSYSLILTTTVHYNNFFGKLYFFFVKPFHKIVVLSMLHSLVNNISI